MYGNSQAMTGQIIANAANVIQGTNPVYTLDDFYAVYPAYGPRGDVQNPSQIVPPVVLQMYINLADSCIKEARWHSMWQMAMGLFVAHFATLYLQSVADATSDAAQVMAKGQAVGLVTSESAGDVSVSMDYSSIAQDLDGWAAWKLTAFGQQLATFAKMVGKGGMMVY